MTTTDTNDNFGPENATQVWDMLSERLEAFVTAWEAADEPPPLRDFLPQRPLALKHLALVELIKVDLEYRWRQPESQRFIEDYVTEFPDLEHSGAIPCDLLYEEYHVRKQSGEAVDPRDYFERFPSQAEELGRLLGLEAPELSTALFSGERAAEFEVGDQIDDFDLLTELGKGAFATVFLARQRSMQRMVALKVSADRGTEAQTMAQLDHPNIVRVYDQRILPDRKLRLLYMQYIAGGTLQAVAQLARKMPADARSGRTLLEVIDQALVRRGDSPPSDSGLRRRLGSARWPEVVCWLGARLAAALDYAHKRGVLHRDIKPANVLVAADGTPKLADFNISFSSGVSGTTAAAYFGGSLAYMSPEQLEAYHVGHERTAEDLDGRSDVFSLGVLLWELLTGNRPYLDTMLDGPMAETLDRMIATRRLGVGPSARQQSPGDSPEGLVDVLLKCLEPDPVNRFQTAGQLARQLELVMQPRAQRLLRPRASRWKDLVRRLPSAAIVLAGLLPNMVMSQLNIQFNFDSLEQRLRQLKGLDVSWISDFFSSTQVLVVNAIAYPVGIALVFWLVIPLSRAIKRARRGKPPDAEHMEKTRDRNLRVGDYMARIALALWLITGPVFPIWIHYNLMKTGQDDEVPASLYAHFLTSQFISGLIAATLTFFFATFLCVRFLYPMLLQVEGDDDHAVEQLARLSRRLGYYFVSGVSVLFVALVLLAIFGVDNTGRPEDSATSSTQWALVVAAVGGLVSFGVSYLLMRLIREDLSGLIIAALPPGETVTLSTDTADTFWSGSRR